MQPFLKNQFELIRKLIQRIYLINKKLLRKKLVLNNSNVLKKSTKFIVNECIQGDYYEFGVWKGQTLVASYLNLIEYSKKRIRNSLEIGQNLNADNIRKLIALETNFHAFDSFQGLPILTKEDSYSNDFFEGQFAANEKVIENLAQAYNMPLERLIIHKGWFSKTCNIEYLNKFKFKKASIIWLDCDLYSSAKECFKLITYLIQDGTILILDDWFSNKGSPLFGVQKAFYEWKSLSQINSKWIFTEYQKDTWKRNSFIINSKN